MILAQPRSRVFSSPVGNAIKSLYRNRADHTKIAYIGLAYLPSLALAVGRGVIELVHSVDDDGSSDQRAVTLLSV